MGLRMKNCTITGFTKTAIFFRGEGRGVGKNQYIGGELPKNGTWTVCRFKGDLAKIREWCF